MKAAKWLRRIRKKRVSSQAFWNQSLSRQIIRVALRNMAFSRISAHGQI